MSWCAGVGHGAIARGGGHGLEVLTILHHTILSFLSHTQQVEGGIGGYILILAGD